MKTSEIISAQFKFLSENSKEYLDIMTVPTLISLFNSFFYPYFISNYTTTLFFISILVFVLNFIFIYKAAVSIHRFVILNEHHDYYDFKIKITLVYGLYSILLFLITLGPLIISILLPILLLEVFGSVIGFLLVPVAFIWLFLATPFFALNLPMVAAGKKIIFFKMFSMSKGFRLTLFFQLLLLVILNWLSGIVYSIYPNMIVNIISILLSMYLFALYFSCLSKTYLLWEAKNNFNN